MKTFLTDEQIEPLVKWVTETNPGKTKDDAELFIEMIKSKKITLNSVLSIVACKMKEKGICTTIS